MSEETKKAAEYELLRRRKVYEISEQIIVDVLSGRAKITNLPENSAITGATHDAMSNNWLIYVIHSSFDVVERNTAYDREYLEIERIE